MIPGDDSFEANQIEKCTTTSINYLNYGSYFYKYEESKCDKPLLAHDVYSRWILQNANFAYLTEKQIQLAAYTGYSLMYRTVAENEIRTVVQ